MTDDDLVAKYAAEAKQSLDAEANKRIEETVDPIREAKLRSVSPVSYTHLTLPTSSVV